MTTEINIVTEEKDDTVLVPVAALDGETLQLVTDQNTISLTTIKTGISGTRSVEALSGVADGARIVFPFQDNLVDGQKITPVQATSP